MLWGVALQPPAFSITMRTNQTTISDDGPRQVQSIFVVGPRALGFFYGLKVAFEQLQSCDDGPWWHLKRTMSCSRTGSSTIRTI